MKKYFLLPAIVLITMSAASITYAQSSSVKMNEIYSRGTTTDPDWIELYNSSNSPVDISSYKIYDSGGQGGTKSKKTFTTGTSIAAKGFYVVVTDGSGETDFGLSNNGEEVWLEDGSGTVIDDVVFPALTATQSYGRIPDGETLQILNVQTKGSSNGTNAVEEETSLPTSYILEQNYPNPFNPSTVISYQLPTSSFVTLKVFNILGGEIETVVNEYQNAGIHHSKFPIGKSELTSGIYFYRLQADKFVQIKKMILLK
jgi:hypothetical protein